MRRTPREISLWTIAIVIVLVLALIPVLWLLSISLKPAADVSDGRVIPESFSLENYKSLFEGGFDNSPFLHPLVNSIAIALITTVIAITLAAFTAYAIARLEFPGKRLISWLKPRIEIDSVSSAPRVMMKIESKTRKPSSVRNSRATRIAGFISGRVIRVKRCQAVAPSTFAAS